MTTQNVLTALAQYAPSEIRAISKPGPACILATRVGVSVLENFRIVAEPFPVEFNVFNDAWREWGDANFVGGSEEQLRRGAHLLTNMPNWPGGTLPQLNPARGRPWDGHLVLRVDRWLVDLDLAQCSRPTKQIFLPPAVVAPLGANDVVEGDVTIKGVTSFVVYRPLVAPYADDYKTAGDWRANGEGFRAAVAAITRKMKLALGK